MNKKLQGILLNINQNVDKIKYDLGKKPKGIPASNIVEIDGDDILVKGVVLPSLIIETTIFSRSDLIKQFDSQWRKFLSKGDWNGKPYEVSWSNASDKNYHVMTMQTAKDIFDIADKIIREIFKAIWTEEIYDCDNFMDLFKGLVDIILFRSGLRGAGGGIASIKVDWRDKKHKKHGHALNACPITDDNIPLKWYLVEPQSGRIYDFPKNYEIHFFDM